LFDAIKKALGELPIIAEDLGVITDGVRKLRDDAQFPGMKVLQFAFDPGEAGKDGMVNAFLPHMYPQTSVVYTGTHDNDTMQGWLDTASDAAVKIAADYAFGEAKTEKEARALSDSGELCKALIRSAIASTADMAVIPMQDILGLGVDARMNIPNTTGTNWSWRIADGALTKESAEWLAFISDLYGRNIKK
jgi:4-alpha-glucanotransferase